MWNTVIYESLASEKRILYNKMYLIFVLENLKKADVWSMGIIYYEMLFGTTPWPSRSQYELIKNIKRDPVRF